MFLFYFDELMLKIIFLKKIISIYFQVKITLKNNYYYYTNYILINKN
jgi:hypothetical protein